MMYVPTHTDIEHFLVTALWNNGCGISRNVLLYYTSNVYEEPCRYYGMLRMNLTKPSPHLTPEVTYNNQPSPYLTSPSPN